MGDKFQVSQGELDTFAEGHGARQLQTGNRLSKDLTLVGADVSELDKKTCRWIDGGLIHNEDEAKRKCPEKCSTHAPLSRWNGQWQTPKPGEMSQCSCCPAVRP